MMSPKSAQRAMARKPRLNLSAAREKAGLSIAQIAESTKISSRFLRAVEEESFRDLPGGIFSSSYIRQYASAVGVDANEILRAYYEAIPGAAPVEPALVEQHAAKDPYKVSLLRWLGVSTAASRF